MSDYQDFPECTLFDEHSNELDKHEKLSIRNATILSKQYDFMCEICVELLNETKYEKHLGDRLAQVRKLEREYQLLESKAQRGEETIIKLHEESQNLHSQLLEKKNEVPILAEKREILKEKLKEFQRDENEKKHEVEQSHKSVLLTKDQYKKYLGCHIRLLKSDKQGETFIFKFDNSALGSIESGMTESLPPKSAKFSLSSKKEWLLLETNPTLPNFEQLSQKLRKTQDIQGLLGYLSAKLTFKVRPKPRPMAQQQRN